MDRKRWLKKIGLVDELGGIGKALEIAAQKADLKGYTIMILSCQKGYFCLHCLMYNPVIM